MAAHDHDLKRLREALELLAEAATTPSIDTASPSPDSRREVEPSHAVAETEGA